MDFRNLLLLLVFAFSTTMLWQAWQKQNHPPSVPQAVTAQNAAPQPTVALSNGNGTSATPGATGSNTGTPNIPQPSGNLSAPTGNGGAQSVATNSAGLITPWVVEPVRVETDLFIAHISPLGGDLVHLELKKYKSTGDKDKPMILFGEAHRYAAQTGLIGEGFPNHKSPFKLVSGPLALVDGGDDLKVRLEAPGPNGIVVGKTYIFKRNDYQIDVVYDVANSSGQPVAPYAYFQLQRDELPPEGETRMISTFTGPAIFTDQDKYQKIAFADIEKNKANFRRQSNSGWLAMVQHFFVSAWVPPAGMEREFFMRKIETGVVDAGVIVAMSPIAPGASGQLKIPLYAGPQEQSRLAAVAEGLPLVVDYGWLTVIASPLFWVLGQIHKLVGNWGWAIVALTILIKLIFFPLSAASYKSMAKMRTVTPRLAELKEKYGDDKARLNQAMMDLYRTEKINPLGGCLPILVQIPVFIALYWVLLGAVEMRDAPWILWIHDLSSSDPFYVLPVLMMASMIIQTKLNPTPPDPIQAKVMMAMPFVFGVMFFFFPAGLVLYWVVNNILSIAQQWQITRMIEGRSKKTAKA